MLPGQSVVDGRFVLESNLVDDVEGIVAGEPSDDILVVGQSIHEVPDSDHIIFILSEEGVVDDLAYGQSVERIQLQQAQDEVLTLV